eukprot:14913240-Heterocapsa_arctica.AAC.1
MQFLALCAVLAGSALAENLGGGECAAEGVCAEAMPDMARVEALEEAEAAALNMELLQVKAEGKADGSILQVESATIDPKLKAASLMQANQTASECCWGTAQAPTPSCGSA